MDGRRPLLTGFLASLLVAVILALFVRTWVVQVFRIPSGSMEPGLEVGDHVLVNRFIYGPTIWPEERELLPIRPLRRGDVAVFKFPPEPERDFVKRCIGVAGDRVEIVDKQLFVDSDEVSEGAYVVYRDPRSYSRSLMLDDGYRKRDNFGPVIVPKGQAFFLGDNRDFSHDSRFWGLVPMGYLKGRPLLVLWSGPGGESAEEGSGLRTPRLVR
jgi:signal peptidase I